MIDVLQQEWSWNLIVCTDGVRFVSFFFAAVNVVLGCVPHPPSTLCSRNDSDSILFFRECSSVREDSNPPTSPESLLAPRPSSPPRNVTCKGGET